MPLYMDLHKHLEELTDEAIRQAHAADLEVQGKHGTEYLKYWYDKESGFVSCLVRAPSMDAARAVHQEAHGLVADEIYEVLEGA